MLLEGLSTMLAACRCSSVPVVACGFGQSTSQLHVLHAEVQCVMHFPFMLAVRLLKLLLVSNAHQFARRLLDDEGWCGHHSSENSATILRCCSTCIDHLRFSLEKSGQEVGVPVHSGRLTVFTKALHGVMPTHSLLVIDGCSSWTSPRISVVGTVSVKL